MKNKKEKQQDLDQLRAQLEANKNIFLAGYEKMKVDQDFELRKTVRNAGGTYKVIKNRIAEKAAEGGEASALLKDLKGMLAIAYTSGDPVALAKALTEKMSKTVRQWLRRRSYTAKTGGSIPPGPIFICYAVKQVG